MKYLYTLKKKTTTKKPHLFIPKNSIYMIATTFLTKNEKDRRAFVRHGTVEIMHRGKVMYTMIFT